MRDNESPLRRSIGVAGVIHWLMAAAGVIAIGAALNASRWALGIAGAVFLLVALGLAWRARRARADAEASIPRSGS